MFTALFFNTYDSMFYNRNSNLNKWFVSPYLTISKEISIFFRKKSPKDKKMVVIKELQLKTF